MPASSDTFEAVSEPPFVKVSTPPAATDRLVQVAVPSPLYGLFDYVWDKSPEPRPGARVSVPFGRRHVQGVLVAEIERSDVPPARLRRVGKVLDAEPLLPSEMLSLLLWASRYYHHPVGEVLAGALPVLLRRGAAAELERRETWRLSASFPDGPADGTIAGDRDRGPRPRPEPEPRPEPGPGPGPG